MKTNNPITNEHLEVIENLSKNIKRERLKQNLSQSHLSALSGIEVDKISKLENMENINPTIGTLGKISKGLNTSIVSLISTIILFIQPCLLRQ